MAQTKLESVAIDRSLYFKRSRNASEKLYKKRERNKGSFTRNLEVAINLHNYMKESGMSRAELAKKLSVSQAYICNLINGKLNPTIGTIEKYEQILGTNLLPEKSSFAELPLISSLPEVTVHRPKRCFNDSKEESNNSLTYGYPFQFLAY